MYVNSIIYFYLVIKKQKLNKLNITIMATTFKNKMREVMQLARQFVRKNGYSMSEALKAAWLNTKLKAALASEWSSSIFKR